MPQEPKRRHSRQRQGKRRASIRLGLPSVTYCPNCKNVILPHRACSVCGFYKGRQVLVVEKPKVPTESKNEDTP